MLEYLDGIRPEQNAPLEAGVRDFCLRNTGKGIVVLISDLMDKNGYESALRWLIARRVDLYVIQVLSPAELRPDLQGDLKLVDCEDGDETELTISRPLLDRYEKTLAAFVNGAREFCSRRGVSYVMASSQTPVEDLVATYLRKRGLVR
jgi:hypothetical protein